MFQSLRPLNFTPSLYVADFMPWVHFHKIPWGWHPHQMSPAFWKKVAKQRRIADNILGQPPEMNETNGKSSQLNLHDFGYHVDFPEMHAKHFYISCSQMSSLDLWSLVSPSPSTPCTCGYGSARASRQHNTSKCTSESDLNAMLAQMWYTNVILHAFTKQCFKKNCIHVHSSFV